VSATTPQRQLAEEERRRLELEARGGLDQLVQLLTKAASDAWHDQRLWGHGDRARYFGRSADLIMTVDKLSKVILDHPDAGVRTERLVALHDALEAAAIIGGCLKTPAANRLRTVAVTEKRRQQARAQVPRTAEIIEDEFNKLREKYPNKDFKKKGPWKTARVLKQRCEREGQLALEADTIARYLIRLPYFSPTDSD
jgi:hypothetical protein